MTKQCWRNMRHKVFITPLIKWMICVGAPCLLVELLQLLRKTKTQANVSTVNIHFVLTARIEYTLARGAMSIALIYSPSIGIKCGRSLNKTNSWRKDSITFTSKIVPNPAQTRNVMLQSPWNMDKKDAAKFSAHSAGSGSAGFASNKRKAISISKRIQITGVMRDTFSR